MRSLGRLIAVSLVGGCLFVGCVASPQTGRLASRAPHQVELIDGRSEPTVEPAAVAPVDTTVPAAPASVEPDPRVRAQLAKPPQRRVAAPGRVAATRDVPTPPRSSPSAPSWERMHGEVGNGPFTVAQASRDGLPVSMRPDEEPAIHLGNPTANGSPRVVLVVAEQGEWLQVLLPIRPNSSLGWVRKADVSQSVHGYHVVVEQGAHRIRVYDNGKLITDEPVAVGKGSTPTPTGQFFIADLMRPSNPNGAYGPYAFGLSAYSDVYQRFGNGDGVVGIHGTNEPSSIGRDATHGCIRVHNDTITYLAGILPLGTPVAIRP